MKTWKFWVPIIIPVVLAFLGWLVFDGPTYKQDVKDSSGSIITQGQIGNNTIVNPEKPDRAVTSEDISSIKQLLPDKNRKINISKESYQPETTRYSEELKKALLKEGRDVSEIGTTFPFPYPQNDIYIETDTYTIYISDK